MQTRQRGAAGAGRQSASVLRRGGAHTHWHAEKLTGRMLRDRSCLCPGARTGGVSQRRVAGDYRRPNCARAL